MRRRRYSGDSDDLMGLGWLNMDYGNRIGSGRPDDVAGDNRDEPRWVRSGVLRVDPRSSVVTMSPSAAMEIAKVESTGSHTPRST